MQEARQDYLGYLKCQQMLVFRQPNLILEVYTDSKEVKKIRCTVSILWKQCRFTHSNIIQILFSKLTAQRHLCLTEILKSTNFERTVMNQLFQRSTWLLFTLGHCFLMLQIVPKYDFSIRSVCILYFLPSVLWNFFQGTWSIRN